MFWGATPKLFVFKKFVESIAAGENPEGDPHKEGGKTKSLGLGITSLSSSVNIPGPNLTEVKPVGSLSTVYLLGTLLIFKIKAASPEEEASPFISPTKIVSFANESTSKYSDPSIN